MSGHQAHDVLAACGVAQHRQRCAALLLVQVLQQLQQIVCILVQAGGAIALQGGGGRQREPCM